MEKLQDEFKFTLSEEIGEGDGTIYTAKLNGEDYNITWEDDCPEDGVDYLVVDVEEMVKDKDWLVL